MNMSPFLCHVAVNGNGLSMGRFEKAVLVGMVLLFAVLGIGPILELFFELLSLLSLL